MMSFLNNAASRRIQCLEAMRDTLDHLHATDTSPDDGLTAEHILSVEEQRSYDLLLSYGGPSDWLRVFVKHEEIVRIEYHYATWGSHEAVDLTEEETVLVRAWCNHFLPLPLEESS